METHRALSRWTRRRGSVYSVHVWGEPCASPPSYSIEEQCHNVCIHLHDLLVCGGFHLEHSGHENRRGALTSR